MKAKLLGVLILANAAIALMLVNWHPDGQAVSAESQPPDTAPPAVSEPLRFENAGSSENSRPVAAPDGAHPLASQHAAEATITPAPTTQSLSSTNKLERLAQTRETFQQLAAGDPATALRAAKQIKNETERETALLTLVTEWTHGELGPSQQRAQAITAFGLEAGLGMELAKYPDLAVLWANELTASNTGRNPLLWNTALATVISDPSAAFALGDQIVPEDRGKFFDALYAGWAAKDTDAALRWVDQVSDPNERDGALAAIRSVAPVGIGASLAVQDGYPIIQNLVPGAPSELSGLLHPGDRIVAVAQGYGSFVDAHSLPLQDVVQMVRGAPGTIIQLQVLPADAPANSTPRTVPITRQQIKFKQ